MMQASFDLLPLLLLLSSMEECLPPHDGLVRGLATRCTVSASLRGLQWRKQDEEVAGGSGVSSRMLKVVRMV